MIKNKKQNLIKIKIRKGDNVVVISGKDKGKQGIVERVWQKEATVLVPGLNVYKKHVKPRGEGRPGEIMTLSRPLNLGKVMVVDPKSKLPARIGYRFEGKKKIRVTRKYGTDL